MCVSSPLAGKNAARLARADCNHGSAAATCFVIPPYMLNELARREQSDARGAAISAMRTLNMLNTIDVSAGIRGKREVTGQFERMRSEVMTSRAVAPTKKNREVYDAKETQDLPGKLVRKEGQGAIKDIAANEAYSNSGYTWDFYNKNYGRNSIDDKGMKLSSTVHFDRNFDNAFWDGTQMVYGDGDGVIFTRFTRSLDVIGHELTHGVTQFEAGLVYRNQPGALNEHFSDVFGMLVKQWHYKLTVDKSDWIVGKELLAKGVNGVGIRSMKDPGTAYDDPRLGKDPQPAHMKQIYKGTGDSGGVHINSGIPNKAFYLAASEIGGNAWTKTGKIWYEALCNRIKPRTNFAECAEILIGLAGELYGVDGVEQKAVRNGWKAVGVI